MKNVLQLVDLIPLLPLIGFLINGLGRKYLSKSLIGDYWQRSYSCFFVMSVWVFFEVKNGNTHVADYFNFISVGNLKIPFAFQIDQLSSLFLLIITGVGFLIHVYSTSYMHEEKHRAFWKIFFLSQSVCVFHAAAGNGRQLCDHVHWLGRSWALFLFIDRLLV